MSNASNLYELFPLKPPIKKSKLKAFFHFLWRHCIWTAIALSILINVIIFVIKSMIPAPVYQSNVPPADCALCGEGNYYRGENTVAFVTTHYWNIRNIGMKRYCGGLDPVSPEFSCEFDIFRDDSLTAEELAHKYAPLDVNGVLREACHVEDHTCYHFIQQFDEKNGTTGTITVRTAHGLIEGTLKLDPYLLKQNEDREHLSTILCPNCYDKVCSVTENIDCFLLDCETMDVYTLYKPEWKFKIGDYDFEVFYRSSTHMRFRGLYEPGK